MVNNKFFHEDVSGYVIVPVNVSDSAGWDTTNVKVTFIDVYTTHCVWVSICFGRLF